MFTLLFPTSTFNHLSSTSTVTVATVTSLVDMKKRDEGMLLPRQQTVIPASIPTYASACSGSVRYSSACSCIGVTAKTTFAPTPTYIKTVTATTTVVSPPTYAAFHPLKKNCSIPPFLTNNWLRLPALQYYNADDCTNDNQPLATTFTLNTCVAFPTDYSLSFGTFIGGACSPDQCSVLLYGDSDLNCATTPAETLPVTDSACINIVNIYSGQLVCPTCPQS